MHTYKLVVTAILVAGCTPASDKPSGDLKPNDWLLAAEDEEARNRLIQQQFRGFDQPMWEVGERYARLHEALERQNTDLAVYHWEKIRTSIENGIAKRPARRANAEQFLLNDTWQEVDADLRSGEPARAWRGFKRAKAACAACHQAEDVAYMNNQPVFDLAAPQDETR